MQMQGVMQDGIQKIKTAFNGEWVLTSQKVSIFFKLMELTTQTK